MWWYETFVEMWTYGFMVRGFAVTLVAAITCSVLSCYLVLMGWSLLGDALSHAILPGIVLAYMLGAPFSVGALVAALVTVALIGVVKSTSRIKEDTAMGVVFTTLFAAGLVLLSMNPSNVNMHHILFGDMLGITKADMTQVYILAPLALAIILVRRKDLMLFAFDKNHASAIGLNLKLLTALLFTALALTVVVAMQAVGAILIVALLIIPGASAFLLTSSFSRMLVIAPLFSALAVLAGIYLSYWLDAASGSMVVVMHGVLFTLVYVFSPYGLGVLGRRRRVRS